MNKKKLSILSLNLFKLSLSFLLLLSQKGFTIEIEVFDNNNKINCFYKSFPKNTFKVSAIKANLMALASCNIDNDQNICTDELREIAKGFVRATPCANAECKNHDDISLNFKNRLYLCTKTSSTCINTQIFEFKSSHKIVMSHNLKIGANYYSFLNKNSATFGNKKQIFNEEVLLCLQSQE